VLFGKNNSGKTTLARLPLFIASSFSNQESFFSLSAAGQQFGSSFVDLASVDQAHPRVSFGMAWTSRRHMAIELQHVASQEGDDSVQPVTIQIDNTAPVRLQLQQQRHEPAHKLISAALTPEQSSRFYTRIRDARRILSNNRAHPK
jgi:hypothetical protein